jgi:hypothetical protein
MENEKLLTLVNKLVLSTFLNIDNKTKCLTNKKNQERRFIMKLIFKRLDTDVRLSRKIKNEAKRSIEKKLTQGSLVNLQKTVIGKHCANDRDYALYGEGNLNYENIFHITYKKTNYLAGQIISDVFYLIDIGELVWISDHFEMVYFEEKKRITTHLKSKS